MKKNNAIYTIIFTALTVVLLYPVTLEYKAQTWTFYDRHGELLYSEKPFSNLVEKKYQNTKFATSLINIEDQNFYHHPGFDIKSLLRAGAQNLAAQEIISGASTITMQVARHQFLETRKRNLWYKIEQIFYSVKIELGQTKDEILTHYLNTINFGAGAIGIEAASQRYFSKNPETLSIGEIATLIGIIPNPANWNPIQNPRKADERKKQVLTQLRDRDLINEDEFRFWQQEPIKLQPNVYGEIHAPHFVLWTKSQLQNTIDQSAAEIKVFTTLDKKLYQSVLNITRSSIQEYQEKNNAKNSGILVLDNADNSIIVSVGSINFFDQEIDGAVNMTTAKRQTGSILKPFLYGMALEQGWSPADELIDEYQSYPTTDGRYTPRNFDVDAQYGRVRLREALVNSYNLSAVYLLKQIGLKNFEQFLHNIGINIQSRQDLGLGLILGSGSASLKEITNGYSTLANQGRPRLAKFFTHIQDENNQNILTWSEYQKNNLINSFNISNKTTDWLTHALSDNQARLRAFEPGNPLEIDRPAAVKTGTSQEFRDNWVIGYTPDYTVGVWVGNANGAPLHTSSGISGAGPMWGRVMRKLHHHLVTKNFSFHSDRQSTPLCRRPYNIYPDCEESYRDFLSQEEIQNQQPTQQPDLKITFPLNNDIIHKDSSLLIQTLYQSNPNILVKLNNNIVQNPIKNLPLGKNTIEVISDDQHDTVTIFVEDF